MTACTVGGQGQFVSESHGNRGDGMGMEVIEVLSIEGALSCGSIGGGNTDPWLEQCLKRKNSSLATCIHGRWY